MSWPHLTLYALVVAVGLPSSFRNPTAAAIVIAWLIGETTWLITGNNLPLQIYFMADIFVLVVICAKAIRQEGSRTYLTLHQQLKAFNKYLTLWDKLIAVSYILVSWPVYVIDIHPYYRWWTLFYIFVFQLFLVCGEAIQSLLGDRRVKMSKPPGGSGLAFAGIEKRG